MKVTRIYHASVEYHTILQYLTEISLDFKS